MKWSESLDISWREEYQREQTIILEIEREKLAQLRRILNKESSRYDIKRDKSFRARQEILGGHISAHDTALKEVDASITEALKSYTVVERRRSQVAGISERDMREKIIQILESESYKSNQTEDEEDDE